MGTAELQILKSSIEPLKGTVVFNAYVPNENEFGVKPDFTQPVMHWVMNGWIAAQEGREWLSPEEIRIINMRKGAQEKRRKTMEDNRLKARGV